MKHEHQIDNAIDAIQDPCNWLDVIVEAFPKAMIFSVSNFDDSYLGWRIVIDDQYQLEFKYSYDTGERIQIMKHQILIYSKVVRSCAIYDGAAVNDVSSRALMVMLLQNFKSIGIFR